jgi:hypothetical protein
MDILCLNSLPLFRTFFLEQIDFRMYAPSLLSRFTCILISSQS